MHSKRRHFLKSSLGSAATLALGATGLLPGFSPAWAAEQLAQARIINGFPPGAAPDAISRKVGEFLAGKYANNVIVENRTGAGGQLAVTAVKSASPDGSAILLTPMSMMAIYPHTYAKLPYDPVQDFAPVSMAITHEYAFAVGPAVPAHVQDLKGLLDWFTKNPSRASIGSPATGSALHFIVELLSRSAGVPITHVGYRGSAPAIADVLGGTLPAVSCPVGALLNQPNLRALATSGAQRSQFTPNVKTLAEQGFKDMVYNEWYGFFVPAQTPTATVDQLSRQIQAAFADPGMKAVLDIQGLDAAPSGPAGLKNALQRDTERWGKVVKAIGFTAAS